MNLTLNGIRVTVDENQIARMLQERIVSGPFALPGLTTNAPRIGEAWPGQGGVYAGMARGQNGEPDYALIVAVTTDAEEITWNDAKAWAEKVFSPQPDSPSGDLRDFTLPTRREQALLYANVPEHFESAWYWSSEQHAAHADSAWSQGFGNGRQDLSRKDTKFRARAVRRLIIR